MRAGATRLAALRAQRQRFYTPICQLAIWQGTGAYVACMNAFTSDSGFTSALPQRLDPLAIQWAALREAASVVAMLAGQDTRDGAARHLAFPAVLHKAPQRRRVMIEQSIGDLVAMMEPGVAALLSVHELGGHAQAAAHALWQEFVAARGGLVALVPPQSDVAANEQA